jgi:hypothetical protein
MGITGSYYFRMVPESFDEDVIRQIYDMGHEVGYHYEDLSMVAARGVRHEARGVRCEAQGRERPKDPLPGGVGVGFIRRAQGKKEIQEQLVTEAIESFRLNLETLRRIVPVETICMHGSPLSKWDNRLLWQYYDYHDFCITGEPYFDLDFNEVLYLTDTGRRWDGEAVSVRDKAIGRELENGRMGEKEKGRDVETPQTPRLTPHAPRPTPHAPRLMPFPRFRSTSDIIHAAHSGSLPDKIMITVHPQRWTNKPLPWVKELVWQNVKNVAKWMVVRRKA